jgi:hypothetical protein
LLKKEDLCQKNATNSLLTSDTISVYNVVYGSERTVLRERGCSNA